MKFFADEYFCIGDIHQRSGQSCQDYAASLAMEKEALAVIADGCSDGGKTDWGARLVTVAIEQAWRKQKEKNNQKKMLLAESSHFRKVLRQTSRALGLNRNDLLATCLYVCVTAEGGLIHWQGDGAAAIKYRNGDLDLIKVDWIKNQPFYPIYRIEGRERKFQKILVDQGETVGFRVEFWRWNASQNELFLLEEEPHLLSDKIMDYKVFLGKECWQNQIVSVAIFSDGLMQIDGRDWKEAARECLEFKNFQGVFLKRRLLAALRNWRRSGRGPRDDLAVAVIRTEEDKEEL